MTSARPNILLIVCDDLGWGDLGCYGSDRHDTPRIDALARQGVRLTDHYAAAPLCTPSRAGLLTGRYAHRCGLDHGPRYPVLLPGDDAGFDAQVLTLPAILRDNGYATGCFGKWHLGDRAQSMPLQQGFDRFFGLPYSHDMRPSHPQQDRFRFPPLPLFDDDRPIESEPDAETLDKRFTDAAAVWIGKQPGPWLAYLALTAPHVPLAPTAALRARSRHGDYGAVIAVIDDCVACIMGALDPSQDHLIIFTSDHGAKPDHGGSNGPFSGGKNTCMEGGMRVPCIVRRTGKFPAGHVSAAVSSHLDLLPTIAAAAGATLPADFEPDGIDVTAQWQSPQREAPARPFLYYHDRNLQAVRYGDWKLHMPSRRLFNLSNDPAEAHDQAANEPDVVAAMEAFMESSQPC